MARILITSGPTRQYLDPVRFISNASSGRMGSQLVEAALAAGHEVVLVTGPVVVDYSQNVQRIDVLTTEEMLAACLEQFGRCDGVIAAAAPCDYRPVEVSEGKLRKSGGRLKLELIETADIVATLGLEKRDEQWAVCFALETEEIRERAYRKLQRKNCDLVVANTATAIDSDANSVEILDRTGEVAWSGSGSKKMVAENILRVIDERLSR